MPTISSAINIATSGLISGDALNLSLLGILILDIEEIEPPIPPIPPTNRGAAPSGIEIGKKLKKHIRIRFQYKDNIYEDIKEVDSNIYVTIDNIDIVQDSNGVPTVIFKNLNTNGENSNP